MTPRPDPRQQGLLTKARALWRQVVRMIVEKDRVVVLWPDGAPKQARLGELDQVLAELDEALSGVEDKMESVPAQREDL